MRTMEKVLTANDTGETGSHQSGIAIPSRSEIVDFFPRLSDERNPFAMIDFLDPEGRPWTFRYVYYNNLFFGGTRNERRLCRTRSFLRAMQASAGDIMVLGHDSRHGYRISVRRCLAPDSPLQDPPIAMPAGDSGGRGRFRLVCTQGKWTLITTQEETTS